MKRVTDWNDSARPAGIEPATRGLEDSNSRECLRGVVIDCNRNRFPEIQGYISIAEHDRIVGELVDLEVRLHGL